MITAAGGWALLLLVWRLFDKPDAAGPSATIGIQWGIFGAMLAAGALIVAGARVRAVHRPEPPNPVADEFDFERPARRRRAPAATAARATPAPSPRCCATARRGRASRRTRRRAAARHRTRPRSAWATPARRDGATEPASRRLRTACSSRGRFVQPRIEGEPRRESASFAGRVAEPTARPAKTGP